jgi:hypothetical protein
VAAVPQHDRKLRAASDLRTPLKPKSTGTGLTEGEAGDVKCLTRSTSAPFFGETGLFFWSTGSGEARSRRPLHDAKRQHAPYMCRMAENHQTDAGHDAAAIARWDDEGGAAASFADKTAPKYRRMDPSERRVEVPT